MIVGLLLVGLRQAEYGVLKLYNGLWSVNFDGVRKWSVTANRSYRR
jgi:hypothetical protein